MAEEWSDDPDAQEWLAHARDTLMPMIAESAYCMTIAPEAPDPKMAVELGYMILMDKPIVLVVPEGRVISERLRRVADSIIPMVPNDPGFSSQVLTALEDLAERGLLKDDEDAE